MKILRIAFRPETAMPTLALLLASAVAVLLVGTRVVVSRNLSYAFLVWNLFLAWLPLIFALLAQERLRANRKRDWPFAALAGTWLLFFPNAPYICTDLVHVSSRFFGHYWIDLTVVLLCALTGLVLGFLSLYIMQSLVARLFGRGPSWWFIAAVSALSGFGIYLGRFLRFNSWDVMFKPLELCEGLGNWAAASTGRSTAFLFPALFAVFLFLSYLMLYALTHLQPARAEVSGPLRPSEAT